MAACEAKRIAVIGAGLNGIAALRRLSEIDKFQLTCFEKNYALGGQWLYTDETVEDVFGRPIHTAVYNNLRTNIPKQLMEIDGFPLDDYPSFPSWTQILEYLNRVADHCCLQKYIRYNTQVEAIKLVNPGMRDTKWLVTYGDNRKKTDTYSEEFDYVVLCCGNCSIPSYPAIEGEDRFEGLVIHSIRYRRAEEFVGQTVAILGAHFSGLDISFDLSKYATKVYLCHRHNKLETPLPDNIVQKTSGFKRFTTTSVVLENGEELPVDTVIYCTGYQYNFSFLQEGLLEIGKNNLVNNLYKQIVPAQYSTMFFMGIPREVAFFALSDHQALFIKSVIEGSTNLPTQEVMKEIIKRESAVPVDGNSQWEWDNDLSKISGKFQPTSEVLKNIWNYHFKVWEVNFSKCRSLSYKRIGENDFETLEM